MKALDDLMSSIRRMGEDESQLPAKPVDLLLYAPCPVKLVVKEAIEGIVAGYAGQGQDVTAHIPMGCTSVDPYDPIYKQTDPHELPAMIGSIGFGDFWRPDFVDNHVKAGLFQAVVPDKPNPLHVRAGLIDPHGAYTIYGVTPYVFMVDERLLGSLPVPRVWADLLHPRYQGQIIMCGDGDDMADAVILNIHKEFGPQGLQTLAENSKGLMHSSSMVKSVGSGDKDSAAIYVIPAFFAASTRQPEYVKVIWPQDGAAASPLYLLVKRGEHERLAKLVDFFSKGFAAIESAAWFAPMAAAAGILPQEASLKWVGWDFIRENNVTALRDQLKDEFRRLVQARTCES